MYLNFKKLDFNNSYEIKQFKKMFIDYNFEIDGLELTEEEANKFLFSIKQKMTEKRFLILAYLDYSYMGNKPIVGFIYGKVDDQNDSGYKKVGYGYVMELYIVKSRRIKNKPGMGTMLLQYLEHQFACLGVEKMYLTTNDKVLPFYLKYGFYSTNEISPDNNMLILEKEVNKLYFRIFSFLESNLISNLAALKGTTYDQEMRILSNFFQRDSCRKPTIFTLWNDKNELVSKISCYLAFNSYYPYLHFDKGLFDDVYTKNEYRGMGYYTYLLSKAIDYLDQYQYTLYAYINEKNIPSITAHTKVGFIPCCYEEVNRFCSYDKLFMRRSVKETIELLQYRTFNEEDYEFVENLFIQNELPLMQIGSSDNLELIFLADNNKCAYVLFNKNDNRIPTLILISNEYKKYYGINVAISTIITDCDAKRNFCLDDNKCIICNYFEIKCD